MKISKNIQRSWMAGIMVFALLVAACSKIPLVPSDKGEEFPFRDNSKVLLIVVDGVVGKQLERITTPELDALKPNSIFSFEGSADSVTTDPASIAHIMTGNAVGNTEIRDSSLVPRVPRGELFPSFIKRVKEQKARPFRVVAVTPWETLNKTLFKEADVRISVAGNNNDVVRDSTINRLKADSADLVIAHFNNANLAGLQEGFTTDAPAYRAALLKTDEYIGALVKAMRARTKFAEEDWLVIVQSTHGGNGKKYGGFLENERNTFSLYYNARLKSNLVIAPAGVKFGVKLAGSDANAVNASLSDAAAYNVGDKDNFTIEMKMRHVQKGQTANYPAFFSKRANFAGGVPGWVFFQEGAYWQFNAGQVGKGNVQARGANINDGAWHHLTAVIYTNYSTTPFKRFVRVYTDGIFNTQAEITALGNINSPAPLTLGATLPPNGNMIDMYVNDVRIWNDSLPADVIKQYACTNKIDATHPGYAKLIGYWGCSEGEGNRFKNRLTAYPDFVIKNAYKWEPMNSIFTCGKSVPDAPYSKEVFNQIAYWLNVPVAKEWEINGRLWLAQL